MPLSVPLSVPASFDTRDKACETLALGESEALELPLTGLEPGASFLIEILDCNRGNAMAAWESLGSPEAPAREQTALLRQLSMETLKQSAVADGAGKLSLSLRVEPWSVVSVRGL